MMEGIVLAGGFGTRLQTVVSDLPKSMAPIAGRPLLEIILNHLASQGFTRIILSLGYMAETIQKHFGDRFAGIDLIYEVETSPLGTGGAVRQAFLHCISDHVYIFNGDTYLDAEIHDIEKNWLSAKRPIIVSREVPDVSRYGSLQTENGKIIAISEKNKSGPGLINAGCYVLPKGILDHMPLGKNFSLETDFFPQAVIEYDFSIFITHGLFIDIGIPKDYFIAQTLLSNMP
jgi:D-glycero-alpha-D-manno-heptose 1-phosphate guanylyltransferase